MHNLKNLPLIDSPKKVVDQLKDIQGTNTAQFAALYLNSQSQLVHKQVFAKVDPKEIFTLAKKHQADKIIFAQNHLLNDVNPTEEDNYLNTLLEDNARSSGIILLDHLIITPTDFLSFREEELK